MGGVLSGCTASNNLDIGCSRVIDEADERPAAARPQGILSKKPQDPNSSRSKYFKSFESEVTNLYCHNRSDDG